MEVAEFCFLRSFVSRRFLSRIIMLISADPTTKGTPAIKNIDFLDNKLLSLIQPKKMKNRYLIGWM